MSTASNPGWFVLSDEKLARLHPELYPGGGMRHWIERRYGDAAGLREEIATCLKHGDCRAAVVIALEPLVIAAYSDEFDAVVMLRFPSWLASSYGLGVGTRLTTVNNYESSISRQTDFKPGPLSTGQYTGFYPLIAEFLTDDGQRLAAARRDISEDEWRRAESLGRHRWMHGRRRLRDGRPRYARFGGGWLRPAAITGVAIFIVVVLVLRFYLL